MDPKALIAERQAILDRMVNWFMVRPGLTGLFIAGSLAEGNSDEYSDIDFRAVFAPHHFDVVFGNRATNPAHWGELILNQWWPDERHSVSHFKPFIKVDTFYYRTGDLQPSPWHTLPLRVLYDPDAHIRGLLARSAQRSFTPTPDTVGRSIDSGIAFMHEVYRRAKRGELAHAHEILGKFRQSVTDADDFLEGRPPVGLSHVEDRASPEVARAIIESYVSANPDQIISALQSLAALYEVRVTKLGKTFPLHRDAKTDAYCFRIIREN